MWKVAHEQPPPPPPPPATPFDEMGQVISTMGIQTDEGEFKELFMMQPEVTTELAVALPSSPRRAITTRRATILGRRHRVTAMRAV